MSCHHHQKSLPKPISSPKAASPAPFPRISSSQLVSSVWKFSARCKVSMCSTCDLWTPADWVCRSSAHVIFGIHGTNFRPGTLDNPIIVKSFGDEQYLGCTGCPADSHVVIWLTTSRDRPLERCPECGSVYKLDYVGPTDDGHGHGHGAHGDIHDSSDGQHNYAGEPKTMADYVRAEYR